MTDKTNLPVFVYAIASLAALVVLPMLALTVSGYIAFGVALGFVLIVILLTRSLFMNEARAFWLVARASPSSQLSWSGQASVPGFRLWWSGGTQ